MTHKPCLMLDVDGVLVDGRPQDGLPWNCDLETDLGISSKQLTSAFFETYWENIILGKLDILEALTEVLQSIAPQVRPKSLLDYWFRMDSRIDESVLADIRSARTSDIPIFLATNQEHMRADYLMRYMGLGREVDGIVYSAEAGFKKPQRGFFRYAEICTGYDPKELILVDDTISNIDAARAAGWQAIHWDGSVGLAEILHDAIHG